MDADNSVRRYEDIDGLQYPVYVAVQCKILISTTPVCAKIYLFVKSTVNAEAHRVVVLIRDCDSKTYLQWRAFRVLDV